MRWLVLCMAFLFFSDLHAKKSAPHPKLNVQNPSQYIPAMPKYDHILSANENYKYRILEKAKNFPFSKYKIYSVKDLGLFLLDAKPDWIKDELKHNRPWESYIAPYIKQYVKPNTIVIDAGAHIGTHTLNLSRAVGPEGTVLAFEPQPKTFCELFMNTQINGAANVWVFWAALGDKIGEIKLPNFNPGVEVTYLFDFTYGDSGNSAPIITLDSLNLTNVSFMKVDVDGCDDIFLDGARETILRNKPVMVFEIVGGADVDNTTPELKQRILNTQQKIKDLGYELRRIAIHDYLCTPAE